MSNVIVKIQKSGNNVIGDKKVLISISGVNCVNINIVKNATNDDLNISFVQSIIYIQIMR